MTNEAVNDLRWEEFRKYTKENTMSGYERRLLRDWVRSGHSVYETVESRYLPGPSYPPMDFLDAYRLDRELRNDMKGMTRDERTSYLKAYMGWEDPAPEEITMAEAREPTPELIRDHIRRPEREVFNLSQFVGAEGMLDEAKGYVKGEEMRLYRLRGSSQAKV